MKTRVSFLNLQKQILAVALLLIFIAITAANSAGDTATYAVEGGQNAWEPGVELIVLDAGTDLVADAWYWTDGCMGVTATSPQVITLVDWRGANDAMAAWPGHGFCSEITLTFDMPVNAIGFNVYESGDHAGEATLDVTFASGNQQFLNLGPDPGVLNDIPFFVGVSDLTDAITSVTFNTSTIEDGWAMDEISLGLVPTWYVDDDAPSDPGPGDPLVSDPLEDGSLDHPFDTIQEAIDAASDCDTINVAEGTYVENLVIDGKSLYIEGGWNGTFDGRDWAAKVTTIDGGGTGRCMHYTTSSGGDLSGFTITGGHAQGTYPGDWPHDHGGAVLCDHSSPTIRNNRITGNSSSYACGGVCCYYSSSPMIVNNLITGNTADYGGGIFCFEASPMIVNCTIAGNTSHVQGGGGIYVDDFSSATIVNCIFWGNEGGEPIGKEIYLKEPSSTLIVSYSDVEGGEAAAYVASGCTLTWGEGNFDADPLFADPDNGDYHLKSEFGRWHSGIGLFVLDDVTSLCIDGGDQNDEYPNETSPRGCSINMGAYGNTVEASRRRLDGDLNGDGVVNILDMIYVRNKLNSPCR